MSKIYTIKELSAVSHISENRLRLLVAGKDESQLKYGVPRLPAKRLIPDKGSTILVYDEDFWEWFKKLPDAIDDGEDILEEIDGERGKKNIL